jgi:hypothetical protein
MLRCMSPSFRAAHQLRRFGREADIGLGGSHADYGKHAAMRWPRAFPQLPARGRRLNFIHRTQWCNALSDQFEFLRDPTSWRWQRRRPSVVQRVPDRDIREHNRPAPIEDRQQHFCRYPPFTPILRRPGQRRDVTIGIEQTSELAAVRQFDRRFEQPVPLLKADGNGSLSDHIARNKRSIVSEAFLPFD